MLYAFHACFTFILIVKENPAEFRFELYIFIFSQEDKEGHWRECLMVCMSWLFGRPFCCEISILHVYTMI